MVQLVEYRIVMPISIDEYQVAQRYMVTEMQKENTGSAEGVEVLKNEPFDNHYGTGQYTHKIYHLSSKLPSWLLALCPPTALQMEEEAWNAYPKSKTVLTCPYFNKFKLVIESVHIADNGKEENVHNLSQKELAMRKVDLIDIAAPKATAEAWIVADCGVNFSAFKSKKTGRGPLKPGWMDTVQPVMTAYKLVTIDAPYWGFGYRLEALMLQVERALFNESHRKCFSWIDAWYGLTMDDILKLEKVNDALGRKMLGKAQGSDEEGPSSTNGIQSEEMELSTTPKVDRGGETWKAESMDLSSTPKSKLGTPRAALRSSPGSKAIWDDEEMSGTPKSSSGTPRGKRQWVQEKHDAEQGSPKELKAKRDGNGKDSKAAPGIT